MAFNPIRDERGQPRVRCICDGNGCGRVEVVSATYNEKDTGQAANKIQRQGWSYIGKKRLLCPGCEAKRKVHSVPKNPTKAEPPAEPTRKQKREIMDLLEEVYDVESECYLKGDTDASVASVLSVMPGFVAQIREEFFGPDGANQDLAEALELAERLTEACGGLSKELKEIKRQVELVSTQLAKIKKAVGPHVLAKANL